MIAGYLATCGVLLAASWMDLMFPSLAVTPHLRGRRGEGPHRARRGVRGLRAVPGAARVAGLDRGAPLEGRGGRAGGAVFRRQYHLYRHQPHRTCHGGGAAGFVRLEIPELARQDRLAGGADCRGRIDLAIHEQPAEQRLKLDPRDADLPSRRGSHAEPANGWCTGRSRWRSLPRRR